jgi:hypothetical protein
MIWPWAKRGNPTAKVRDKITFFIDFQWNETTNAPEGEHNKPIN